MKTEKTAFHHEWIDTPAKFARTLNAGPYAWPGMYPLFFVTSDGESLSFDSAKKCARNICDSIRHKSNDGWQVIGCAVNWEDRDMICAHSGKPIASAYGND